MRSVKKTGVEFVVNSQIQTDQRYGATAALTDGRTVAIWQSDASGTFTVNAQILNADGTKSGDERVLFVTGEFTSGYPDVTGLSDGRFFVTWGSNGGGDIRSDIMGQIFGPDGLAQGNAFVVTTTTANTQELPTVTTLTDGRFVVAWEDASQTGGDTSGFAVRAQMFNADGTLSGPEFLANATILHGQQQPAITQMAGGGFAIAWVDQSTAPVDGFGPQVIRAQLFGPLGGTPRSDILISSPDALDAGQPSIAQLQNGFTAVTWAQTEQDQNGGTVSAIYVQMVAADAVLSNLPIRITGLGRMDAPSIISLQDGRFAVAWDEIRQGNHNNPIGSIFVQVFGFNGVPSGDAVLLNDSRKGFQTNPQMVELPDGRILVTWDGATPGAFSPDQNIHGRIVDPHVGPEVILGTFKADNLVGTDANEVIRGGSGSDMLSGMGGKDQLFGGTGPDKLLGGDGADQFVFANVAETGKGDKCDVILDFQSGEDRINLRAFFDGGHYIGAHDFVIGDRLQLRYEGSIGLLRGDINGDGVADFNLQLMAGTVLRGHDFAM
jgi:Ca2+-binding RTX toxin-like protein